MYDKVDWRAFQPAPIIGVDEVGRGCLAGPVFACAVIFNPEAPSFLPLESLLTDSKLLTESKREILSEKIIADHRYCVGTASVEEIDSINILQASLLAMKRAVDGLALSEGGHILVDGKITVPGMSKSFRQTPLIKGDLRCSVISAASIVAKVHRDRHLKELGSMFPGYGLEVHKGYSTVAHKKSIQQLGPVRGLHRLSFSGVKEYVAVEKIQGPLV